MSNELVPRVGSITRASRCFRWERALFTATKADAEPRARLAGRGRGRERGFEGRLVGSSLVEDWVKSEMGQGASATARGGRVGALVVK